jgi:hypothetical protein
LKQLNWLENEMEKNALKSSGVSKSLGKAAVAAKYCKYKNSFFNMQVVDFRF